MTGQKNHSNTMQLSVSVDHAMARTIKDIASRGGTSQSAVMAKLLNAGLVASIGAKA